MKKPLPMWKKLLIDLLLTGVFLCVFALFHHVLPQTGDAQPLAVVTLTAQPTAQAEATAAPASDDAASVPTADKRDRGAGKSAGKSKGGRGAGGDIASGGEKGGSALTDAAVTAEPTTQPTDETLRERWSEQFTDTVVSTASSYKSPNVSITVSENTRSLSGGEATYYMADIYVADMTAFQTVLAQNTYGTGFRQSILDMANGSGALLAINGDYYGNSRQGVVIRNGVAYRAASTDCDVCVVYQDGTMRTMNGASFDLDEAVAQGAWQAWTFGPALLSADGEAIDAFSSTNRLISRNPRTALGYLAPGHFCFVVVDGRGESDGVTLPELSQLMQSLGCSVAYNLDGGNSSEMVFADERVNAPSGGGRESSDCLIIKEVQ